MNISTNFSRITLVSGSWPPEICGVGDFMNHVWQELANSGHVVDRLTLARGCIIVALHALVRSFGRENLVYVSYPTEGYGKSLLPFLLAFGDRRKVILHMHEYTTKNRFCRFLLRRFQRLDRLFFSNHEDYLSYVSDCGLYSDSQKVAGWNVMPTPSNIPVIASEELRSPTIMRVIHFGQIRPHKGLEELVEVMSSLQNDMVDRLVIGGVPKGYEVYASEISERFVQVGVTVKMNLTSEQISHELATAHIGIFPFPDGADERRGSLIAAMAHGLLCVTTYSHRTPQLLKSATIGCEIQNHSFIGVLTESMRRALIEFDRDDNRQRVMLSRKIAGKASFHAVAEQLLKVKAGLSTFELK